ncbi:TIGR02206 family membrane protein [Ectobacillus sp. SYSU M60031]|uniref:TIGR02206 family membrane protein n=2 Tax=Ectobacillus ponti TaxID=2961894 RepID=A0AA42BRX5_9BACI|nr:TIGR02206 family membrane protein [Ectobacillus ponti]
MSHWAAIAAGVIGSWLIFHYRRQWRSMTLYRWEQVCGFLLLAAEGGYHAWLVSNGFWSVDHALPLELCSLSILLSAVLLLTGNRFLYDLVFFIGIAGALQAVLTPVLSFGFPHFRYLHFFFVHLMIIWTSLYFTWVKGYRPTLRALWRTMLVLNMLLPVVWLVNWMTDGNYMFLMRKPSSQSLLDWLGPHPWYMLSLEFVAAGMFFVLWLLFREKQPKGDAS